MVDRPGRLTTLVVGRLLSSVDFAQRCIDAMRTADEEGTVVYVMKSRSLIDYVYFNLAFREHGLKLVRFANDVRTWMIRPNFRALGTWIRGRRGLPSDLDCMEALVEADEPTMLFMARPRSTDIERAAFALPYLRRLVSVQRRTGRPINIIPQLLIWERRPDSENANIFDEVFGKRQSPTFIRKLISVFQNFWQSFLNLGRPLVQVSAAIPLTDFIAERPDLSDLEIAEELSAALHDTLGREERVVVGPWVKRAGRMREELLRDPRVIADIQALDDPRPNWQRTKDARKLVSEIAADFSPLVLKSASAFLSPVWNIIYDGFELDSEGLARVRKVARDKNIVLVPSHKSHIDYLVISYLFYHNGLIPPHIAAGVNLSFWPMGPIFRRCGAFFLRRSFSDDELYRTMFSSYLVKLLEEGFSVEFFIEGTRSRTGKLNAPKYGMLNMIVEAFRAGNVDDLAFVPVYVGYEKIIEGSSYQKELEGGEKKSEGVTDLIKSANVLRSRYGRVYVEFGQEIDLSDFLTEYHEDTENIPKEELERSVRRLAYGIVHEINEATTVTPSALAALVLLNSPAGALSEQSLVREVGFAMTFLRARGARMSRTLAEAIEMRAASLHRPELTTSDPDKFSDFDRAFIESDEDHEPAPTVPDRLVALGGAVMPPVHEALELLRDNKLLTRDRPDDEEIYAVRDDRRLELAFYKNNIVHYFIGEAVFAAAVAAAGNIGSPVAIADAKARASFFSTILKFEFCFAERRRFDDVFSSALQRFVDSGWITRIDDTTIRISDPPAAGFEFFRGLLIPTMESFSLVAQVIRGVDEWTDEKALMKKTIAAGRSKHMKKELLSIEATAKTAITSALRLFRTELVLESRKVGRGRRSHRELRVHEDWRGERLQELVTQLQRTTAAQRRVAGEVSFVVAGDAKP